MENIALNLQEIQTEVRQELRSLNEAANKIVIRQIMGDRFLTGTGQIPSLMLEFLNIRQAQRAMTIQAREFFSANPPTETLLENYKKNVANMTKALRDLTRRMEESHNLFLKYDLPTFWRFGSRGAYIEALRTFMRIWREEAERGRERGLKSLADRSPNPEVRLVAVNAGYDISLNLSSYFMFMSIWAENWEQLAAKFEEVFNAIRFLSVGNGSSVIINRFITALDIIYYVWAEFWRPEWERGWSVGAVIVKEKESREAVRSREVVARDLIHLILREVLRLEVAFYCPYVPPACSVEGFWRLEKTMRGVFRQRRESVIKKINELTMCLRRSEVLLIFVPPSVSVEGTLRTLWNQI